MPMKVLELFRLLISRHLWKEVTLVILTLLYVAASQPRPARLCNFRVLLGSGDQAVILSCMIVSSAVSDYFAR